MRFSSVALLGASLFSCSHAAHIRTDDSPAAEPEQTVPSHVQIFSTRSAGQDYEVLGLVLASKDSGEHSRDVLELLREEAAKLGADAVVETQLNGCQGFWFPGLLANGIAVKYVGVSK